MLMHTLNLIKFSLTVPVHLLATAAVYISESWWQTLATDQRNGHNAEF